MSKLALEKLRMTSLPGSKTTFTRMTFLVLKFDVDEGVSGPTMEWGFLGDLLYSDALGLVDEFYTELHYRQPDIHWKHETHSSRQRYDIVRQLRACGMAIHDWP
jgi:hypothetical protein